MKKIITFVLMIALAVTLVACVKSPKLPPLTVIGDVATQINISDEWLVWQDENKCQKVAYQGRNIMAIELPLLWEGRNTIDNVVLKANDGFMVQLDPSTLNDTYIGYDNDDEWVFVTDKHPVNANIKHINQIIITDNQPLLSDIPTFHIITETQTVTYSLGQLINMPCIRYPYTDGVASVESDAGEKIETCVMKEKQFYQLDDLMTEPIEINRLLLAGADGSQEVVYGDKGYIEYSNQQIHYTIPDEKKTYRNLVGMVVNPPFATVGDVFDDVKLSLNNNEPTMVLFLDGFSYRQYEQFVKPNSTLFLSGVEKPDKALTVYKPVTNAGFAYMITGATPDKNGVIDRSVRDVQETTIFDLVNEAQKTSILIEATSNILNLNTNTVLSPDSNNNGFTDEEVFKNAMTALGDNPDLFMVHFHGIDDVNHNHGAYSQEAQDKIKELDDYIKQLISLWTGKVIIVADHGGHETPDGGDHGLFIGEDMYVPYMVLKEER